MDHTCSVRTTGPAQVKVTAAVHPGSQVPAVRVQYVSVTIATHPAIARLQ